MSIKKEFRIVGICGSLRKYSCNKGLLRAFEQQLPENIEFNIADISEIPFFNQDQEQPFPEPVLKLKELLNSADAVVISSPEYNISYTAVLKNAIEWASRRSLNIKLAGKPVALIGASAIGTAVSQSHLRDVMFALNMNVLNRPIIQIGNSGEKFDSEGNLLDNRVKELLGQLKDSMILALNNKLNE